MWQNCVAGDPICGFDKEECREIKRTVALNSANQFYFSFEFYISLEC